MGEEQKLPELSTGENILQRTIELISSLISLSHSVKVFPGKWQLIRSKLEELNSGLTAAENCESGENPAFAGLIPAIVLTANDCYDHARRCVNLSYSGKLLMQSDLDVISAKFELHIKNLAGIYTAGILTNGHAIVVSKPGVGACRDDMKFYIRDLLTRLKIGSSEMKIQALAALGEVIGEDEKYVRIVVEAGEVISLLVNFLEYPDVQIQEESAKVILLIAGFDSYKGVLVGAGIIAPLIRVLESGSELGKKLTARALQKLTENASNAWSVSAHGGVTALLKICADDSDDKGGESPIGPAFGVLRNLVGVVEIRRFMVEEGAISIFIKLMRSKDEVSQINAIEFLQIMASGDESIRQMITREGGIHSLVCVLDPESSFSSKSLEVTLRAIESFCFSSTNSLNILIGYGFLNQLLFLLRSSEVSVQELVVKVAFRLCSTSEEAMKAMGDAGFMPELVRLLDAKSFEIREMAAEALCSMVWIKRNRRRFVQEDCNVNRILQLLNPEEEKSGNKKFLLSILMALTSCNTGRKKILSSLYLKNLKELADTESIEAKRIVKKLSTNKFRSILNGIWSSGL